VDSRVQPDAEKDSGQSLPVSAGVTSIPDRCPTDSFIGEAGKLRDRPSECEALRGLVQAVGRGEGRAAGRAPVSARRRSPTASCPATRSQPARARRRWAAGVAATHLGWV
jgi:hypothetical protein